VTDELFDLADATVRIARVILDTPVPHLDREFDYEIPDGMDGVAAGVRVIAPLAGRRMRGWVVDVARTSSHPGRLSPLARLVSDVPVLRPDVLQLCRDVALTHAGSVSDVLRLAVPPRHARVEQSADPASRDVARVPAPDGGWEEYTGGPALLRHLATGSTPRAVWTALPGVRESRPAWMDDLAVAARATLASGRRVLVVVPTVREAGQLADLLGPIAPTTTYHAALPPAARYRAFLAILRGHADVVVGTRSAAFAPVPDLGLAVVWDPDDDTLTERRAPYPSALAVMALRRGCALVVGGYSRSVAAQQLIADGWAKPVTAPRAVVRSRAPRVTVPDEEDLRGAPTRLPEIAFRLVRDALRAGPVLVHVPRSGWLRSIRCADCGHRVRCRHCGGPLELPGSGPASCRWCGRPQALACVSCGSTRLTAHGVGSARTSEELARAFPGVRVIRSDASAGVSGTVDGSPALVIATPGAEPVAAGGYSGALILDAAVATARPELAAATVTLDRWLSALALVRSAADGGAALILGDADPVLGQACVRWDPAGFAVRELEERTDLRFPPAWRLFRLTGPAAELGAIAAAVAARGPAGLEVLGPVDDTLLLRVPRGEGRALAMVLRALQRERSARKEEVVRVQLDPSDL